MTYAYSMLIAAVMMPLPHHRAGQVRRCRRQSRAKSELGKPLGLAPARGLGADFCTQFQPRSVSTGHNWTTEHLGVRVSVQRILRGQFLSWYMAGYPEVPTGVSGPSDAGTARNAYHQS
jgi:hypothetical protein